MTLDPLNDVATYLDSLVQRRPSLWTASSCGLTRTHRSIPALVDRDTYLPSARRARVLLIAGLSGRNVDVEQALGALDMFASGGQRFANEIALSAIPCANPDALLPVTVSGDSEQTGEVGNLFSYPA